MKTNEMRAYRQRLEQLRNRLSGDVNAMAGEALGTADDQPAGHASTMPVHMADIGSDAFEQEFTLSLLATEEETLEMVTQALERIKKKTFGKCEGCGGIIAKKRLEALPYASTCIRCAEQLERTSYHPRQPR